MVVLLRATLTSSVRGCIAAKQGVYNLRLFVDARFLCRWGGEARPANRTRSWLGQVGRNTLRGACAGWRRVGAGKVTSAAGLAVEIDGPGVILKTRAVLVGLSRGWPWLRGTSAGRHCDLLGLPIHTPSFPLHPINACGYHSCAIMVPGPPARWSS